jgi:hypothetical protein
MEVEHLMQIYLSLGVMSEVVVPEQYLQGQEPAGSKANEPSG